MKKVIEMSIEDKRFIFDTTFNTILVALIELEKIAERENINLINTDSYYTFENVPSGTVYSLNGYQWYEYKDTSHLFINQQLNGHKRDLNIYFKTKETDLYYECMHSILLDYVEENANEN